MFYREMKKADQGGQEFSREENRNLPGSVFNFLIFFYQNSSKERIIKRVDFNGFLLSLNELFTWISNLILKP